MTLLCMLMIFLEICQFRFIIDFLLKGICSICIIVRHKTLACFFFVCLFSFLLVLVFVVVAVVVFFFYSRYNLRTRKLLLHVSTLIIQAMFQVWFSTCTKYLIICVIFFCPYE